MVASRGTDERRIPAGGPLSPRWPLARHRPALAVAGVFVLATVVVAFPSIGAWASATPGNYGDPFFSQWLLRWNVHSLFGPASVFDPNIFWPADDVLVYSDTTLAAAPAAAAVGFLVGWPLAYNVLYVAGWLASLASAYALGRWLGASRVGAVLTAFVFTFAAVRVNLHGNFPMLSTFLAPLAVLLLLRFLEERRWWQAAALGLCGAAVVLNVGYLAVALVPALAVIAGGWLVAARFRPGRRFVAGLVVAGVVAGALAVPVLLKYRAQGDQIRPVYLVENAITPRNFLGPAEGSLLYGWLGRWSDSPFENRLFPGFAALGLGGVGLAAVAARRPGEAATPSPGVAPSPVVRRRELLLLLLGTLPALVIAFGKFQVIGGRQVTLPYSWVADLVGFKSIRSFGRLTVLPLLGLALLAGLGYDRLVRGRRPPVALAVGALLGVVMLLEYKATIVMSPRIDGDRYAGVNRTLSELPDGLVLELPMGDTGHFTYGFVESPRMALSAIDWNPRVNGYSGYSPPGYPETVAAFNTLDDGGPATPQALTLLDEMAVRYIVVRTAPPDRNPDALGISFLDDAGVARVVGALPPDRIERVSREGGGVLISLRPRSADVRRVPSG